MTGQLLYLVSLWSQRSEVTGFRGWLHYKLLHNLLLEEREHSGKWKPCWKEVFSRAWAQNPIPASFWQLSSSHPTKGHGNKSLSVEIWYLLRLDQLRLVWHALPGHGASLCLQPLVIWNSNRDFHHSTKRLCCTSTASPDRVVSCGPVQERQEWLHEGQHWADPTWRWPGVCRRSATAASLGNVSVEGSVVWSLFQHELSCLRFSVIHP